VQSGVHDAMHLDNRIEAFIAELENIIEELTEDSFASFKTAVVSKRLEKEKTPGETASRLFEEISHHRYQWQRNIELAKSVQALAKDEVLSVYKNFISANGQHRKKMASLVFGSQHENVVPFKENRVIITDPLKFKLSMPLFPCLM